jgi:GNAT superfamily N-acetyltransferase
MRKRTILLIILATISLIVQLFGFPFLGFKFSSHDLEFDYVYNWDVTGTGGYYVGYTENFRANGHYTVDFSGTVATVNALVTWTFQSFYEGYQEESYGGNDIHSFTYSLVNGTYLSGTDQEFDTTGMNVWFHIPGGMTQQTYSILNTTYSLKGDAIIWIGHLMPFTGKRIETAGGFYRNDAYGQFDATFTVADYFTQDGLFLGEIYHETDEGYSDGYWSVFNKDSYIFVSSSNYIRPFNWWLYLLSYWVPILFLAILFFVVYDHYRWKAHTRRDPSGKEIIIDKTIPRDSVIDVKSQYSDLVQEYLTRAKAQDKIIVSARKDNKVVGIGFVEQEEKIGTFFGHFIQEMLEFSKVDYVFSEIARISSFRSIETYDILKIDDLQVNFYNFDADLIHPASNQDMEPIMRLISNEDSGKPKARYARWVKQAYKSDLIVIATASRNENWVADTLKELLLKNYPKPETYNDNVLLGVGFATPGTKTGWLYGLYVHPAFRNQGIGRSIVNARLSILKELGCRSVITEIAEWNGPAKNIYNDLSFQKAGKIYLLGKRLPKVKVRRF